MKSVMISIQPKWCELIANGEKTIEVRKTKPKLETPFKCYIYCTKPKNRYKLSDSIYEFEDELYRIPDGTIKYGTSVELMMYDDYDENNFLNGKVIGEFVCDKIHTIQKRGFDHNFDYCYLSLNTWGNDDVKIEITDIKNSCIDKDALNKYGENSHCLYTWNISELKIYDHPKELSEFTVLNEKKIKSCPYRSRVFQNPDYLENGGWIYGGFVCKEKEDWCCNCHKKHIQHPPQSWCYVEELDVQL